MNSSAGHALDQLVSRLGARGPVVLPALLLCDFGHLAREVERLQEAGAAALHLDVMDGRFAPQLTYGPVVVEAVRRAARVPLEVHLMIDDPDRTLADYVNAGADVVTVHLEALADPHRTLDTISSLRARPHVAISPGTAVERVVPLLDTCDGVLVMGVEPGYGGQRFDPSALGKLRVLAELRRDGRHDFHIGVDGGISTDTVAAAAAAGAAWIVAGSAVIRSGDYAVALANLEHLARNAA